MLGNEATGDNILIVHWHDLGRYLGAYGHPDVSSPRVDRLAAEGFLFTRAPGLLTWRGCPISNSVL